MELLRDTIEAEDGNFFNVLICLRNNPAPHIAIATSVQVLKQNDAISNIGGWIVYYCDTYIETQGLDDFQCILDMKVQIRSFLSGNQEEWDEPQTGTFLLKRK